MKSADTWIVTDIQLCLFVCHETLLPLDYSEDNGSISVWHIIANIFFFPAYKGYFALKASFTFAWRFDQLTLEKLQSVTFILVQ